MTPLYLALMLSCGTNKTEEAAPIRAPVPAGPVQLVPEPEYKLHAALAVSSRGEDMGDLLDSRMDIGRLHHPGDDVLYDGFLFTFSSPLRADTLLVQPCVDTDAFSMTVYANGKRGQAQTIHGNKLAKYPIPAAVSSVYLSLEGVQKGGRLCIAHVGFTKDGVDLGVGPNLAADGEVSASSTLEPKPSHESVFAFDGRSQYAWIEGAAGLGIGESLHVILEKPLTVERVELRNGYQRSGTHFRTYGRISSLGITVDGGTKTFIDVMDMPGRQRLWLPEPMTGRDWAFSIELAVPGSENEHVALTELGLISDRSTYGIFYNGPDSDVPPEHPIATAQDAVMIDICTGFQKALKWRNDNTFVYYEHAQNDPTAPVTFAAEGAWEVTYGHNDKLTLTGRSRTGSDLPIYFEPTLDAADSTAVYKEEVTLEWMAGTVKCADRDVEVTRVLKMTGEHINGTFWRRGMSEQDNKTLLRSVQVWIDGNGAGRCDDGPTVYLDYMGSLAQGGNYPKRCEVVTDAGLRASFNAYGPGPWTCDAGEDGALVCKET